VGIDRGDVPRGAMLVAGPPAPASYRLDVQLRCVAREVRHSDHVEVLHGTAATGARVILIGTERIGPGETAYAQLRLEEPLATVRGDRAIVRTLAPPDTVAGAVVLDPTPPRHAASTERLERLGSGDPGAIVLAEAEVPVEPIDIVTRGLLDAGDAQDACARLLAGGELVALGDHVVAAPAYARIAQAVSGRLAARAAEAPLAPGIPLGALVGDAPWRDALVEHLAGDGVLERHGGEALSPGAAANSATAAEAAAAILAGLTASPFAPPGPRELTAGLGLAEADVRALVVLLEREGSIVRLPDGLVVSRDAYDRCVQLVRDHCDAHGSVTLAQLRDATGTSRKWAQALLERMDADGITRRIGDERVLRRARA
jgi:selenocysteine-specific elongation factor